MNEKDLEGMKKRILEEEDYVYCPRLKNSVDHLLTSNPNGLEDERIASVLLMDLDEYQKIYGNLLEKLKKILGE